MLYQDDIDKIEKIAKRIAQEEIEKAIKKAQDPVIDDLETIGPIKDSTVETETIESQDSSEKDNFSPYIS